MTTIIRQHHRALATAAGIAAVASLVALPPASGASSPDRPGVRLQAPQAAFVDLTPKYQATTLVTAHRGGMGEAPESSELAYRRALSNGYADEIEGDTFPTKDGVWVIAHDQAISAYSASNTRGCDKFAGQLITDLTWAQVKTMKCSGQPVISIETIFSLLKQYPRAQAAIEIKRAAGQPATGTGSMTDWGTKLAQHITASGVSGRVTVESFYIPHAKAVRSVNPNIRIALQQGGHVSHGLPAHMGDVSAPSYAAARAARDAGATIYSYKAKYATRNLNTYIRSIGLTPGVWNPTIWNAQSSMRQKGQGTDIVITGFPQAQRGIYSKKVSCVYNPVTLPARTILGRQWMSAGKSTYATVEQLHPTKMRYDVAPRESVRLKITTTVPNLRVAASGLPYGQQEVAAKTGTSTVNVWLPPGGQVRFRSATNSTGYVEATVVGASIAACTNV